MSVSTYYTATAGTSDALIADVLREIVSLLTAHTAVTVYSVDISTELEYQVVLYSGYGDLYYRLYALGYETSTKPKRKFEIGYLNSGSFVSLAGAEDSTRFAINQAGMVQVINGGDAWLIRLPGWDSGIGYSNERSNILFQFNLLPEFDTNIYPVGGYEMLSRYTTDPSSLGSPNRLYYNGILTTISFFNQTNSKYNIPGDKMLLFPTLITIPIQNGILGVPTIGGQIPYYMARQADIPLRFGTEFYVDNVPYVSLGRLCVRSV